VCGDGRWRIEWGTVGLAVMLVAVALAQLLANAVGGVLVPGNLRLGNVALVSADSIFYPNFSEVATRRIIQRLNMTGGNAGRGGPGSHAADPRRISSTSPSCS
jgi:hypothetical protein